jgi:CRISPR-associated protein Csb1
MFEKLAGAQRLLLEVDLRPVQGDRFQPTGFADLGAAVYERPDGMRMILVESAQSMANRLEHGCLSGNGPRIAPELEGLPYIVAELSGDAKAETSSLIEAHRINSPYIISDKGFQNAFAARAACAKGKPLDWAKIAAALFRYDPNSLLHGVFLANLEDGRVKVPRALTAFIEAEDVREAASGGVKNNPIDPSGKIRAEAEQDNVYGNVPYHRMEYTARKITVYFNMDLASIEGYGLAPEARELLVALGLYKMRHFLDGELRLRTACDLCPKGAEKVVSPAGFILPQKAELLAAVQKGIKACAEKGLFAKPAVTVVKTKVKQLAEGDKKKAKDEQGVDEVDGSS